MKIRYNKILIVVLLIATISFLSFRLSYANLKAFGDVTGNGITNSRDADYINFYLVGNYYDTPLGSTWQHLNGDVTGDDNVDTNDAALMRAFDFCLTNTYDNMPDSLEIVGANEWWGMGGSDIILTARALNMYDDPVGNAYMTFTVIEGNADFGNGRRSIYVKTISGLECFGCSQKNNFGKYSVTLYIGNTPGQRVRVRVSSSGIPCSSRGYGWGCFYCDSVPALTPVYFTAYTYGVNITSPPRGSKFPRDKDITFSAQTIPWGMEGSISWSGGGSPRNGSGGTFTTKFTDEGVKTVRAKLTIGGKTVSASRSVNIIGIDFTPSTLYVRANGERPAGALITPGNYWSSVGFASGNTDIAKIEYISPPLVGPGSTYRYIKVGGAGTGSTYIYARVSGTNFDSMRVNVIDVSFNLSTLYLGKSQTGLVGVNVNPISYAYSVYFKSTNTSIATVSGSYPTITIYGKASGTATIRAYIGDRYFASMTVNVVDVRIIEPNDVPATDNNFDFNSAFIGVCDVNANGTSGISSENSNLTWSIPAIVGSSLSSIPSPPQGPSITFRYTSLPFNNNQFGNKTLSLSHPLTGDSDSQIVQIFYLRDATNHPGAGSGTTPNWYYYWSQITGTGNLAYGGAHASWLGYYDFDGSAGHLDKCIIYNNVTTIGNDDEGGGYGPPGIDSFGQTVIHERKHRDQFFQSGYPDTDGDGIPNYPGPFTIGQDTDGDWLSDSYEDDFGFDKSMQDTDGDGLKDLEEEPEAAEAGWPQNSHNNEDWANPGKNSSK